MTTTSNTKNNATLADDDRRFKIYLGNFSDRALQRDAQYVKQGKYISEVNLPSDLLRPRGSDTYSWTTRHGPAKNERFLEVRYFDPNAADYSLILSFVVDDNGKLSVDVKSGDSEAVGPVPFIKSRHASPRKFIAAYAFNFHAKPEYEKAVDAISATGRALIAQNYLATREDVSVEDVLGLYKSICERGLTFEYDDETLVVNETDYKVGGDKKVSVTWRNGSYTESDTHVLTTKELRSNSIEAKLSKVVTSTASLTTDVKVNVPFGEVNIGAAFKFDHQLSTTETNFTTSTSEFAIDSTYVVAPRTITTLTFMIGTAKFDKTINAHISARIKPDEELGDLLPIIGDLSTTALFGNNPPVLGTNIRLFGEVGTGVDTSKKEEKMPAEAGVLPADVAAVAAPATVAH